MVSPESKPATYMASARASSELKRALCVYFQVDRGVAIEHWHRIRFRRVKLAMMFTLRGLTYRLRSGKSSGSWLSGLGK
jgi:hypothetical protein